MKIPRSTVNGIMSEVKKGLEDPLWEWADDVGISEDDALQIGDELEDRILDLIVNYTFTPSDDS